MSLRSRMDSRCFVALLMLAAGCAATRPGPSEHTGTQPAVAATAPPSASAASPPVASAPPTTAPSSAAAPTAPLPADVPAPCVPAASLPDPKSIFGYVQSYRGSADLPSLSQATIVSVDIEPSQGEMAEWRVTFQERDGRRHELRVLAPKAVSPPLVPGQQVTGGISGTGGGPNFYYGVLLRAADGTPLLAINIAPHDWQVEQGRPEGLDTSAGYSERRFGVRFVPPGAKAIDVRAGKWARTDVAGCGYLLWGNAVERQLDPRKLPPRDFVGSSVDFAIVRGR